MTAAVRAWKAQPGLAGHRHPGSGAPRTRPRPRPVRGAGVERLSTPLAPHRSPCSEPGRATIAGPSPGCGTRSHEPSLATVDFAHRRAGGVRDMTVFGSLRSWCALLLTGFTVIITMLLAQPASAEELVPSNVGVHFWESPGFRESQPDPRAWVPGQPPCPPNKQCAGTADGVSASRR
jgi:hypothetical protein